MRSNIIKIKDSLSGFTLVEVMVAVSIFAVAITAIVGSFLAVNKINAKSRAIRVVEQNARFVSDFFSRELRNGSVDYVGYGGTISSPNNTLRFVNSSGERNRVFLNGTRIDIEKIGIGTSQLTGADVTVSDLKFYISPTSNPFCPSPCPNQQPRVTYTFTISSNIGTRPEDKYTMTVQSTASIKEYPEI